MFKIINKIILALCLIIISGCTTGLSKQKNITQITMPTVQTGTFERDLVNREPESSARIWNEMGSRDFFQDLRAYKVGDIVTINIVETSSASKSASTQTGRNSSINAGIDSILGWEGRLKHLTSMGKSDVRNAYDNTNMFNGSLSNSFNGTGSTSRASSMTAYITAKVLDVKPNGNLFIMGTREIRVNNETQIMALSGLARPVDISPDNTMLSSNLAELKIEYRGTGAVSDKQKPGWLTRVVDHIWPF